MSGVAAYILYVACVRNDKTSLDSGSDANSLLRFQSTKSLRHSPQVAYDITFSRRKSGLSPVMVLDRLTGRSASLR